MATTDSALGRHRADGLRHPPMFGAPAHGGPIACQCCYPADSPMQPSDPYGALPMDLHVAPQGYHPYYR